jgi:hypothetical protein
MEVARPHGPQARDGLPSPKEAGRTGAPPPKSFDISVYFAYGYPKVKQNIVFPPANKFALTAAIIGFMVLSVVLRVVLPLRC